MKISVIIPCYNHGQFLSDAINSVLRQRASDAEIIVVDDGSTDATDQVARSYGCRVKYVAQRNSGLSAARNAGIANATGDALLFLDADDLLDEGALYAHQDAQAKSTGPSVTYSGWREITLAGAAVREQAAQALPPDVFHHLLRANPLPCHCYAVSRKALHSIGLFDVGLRSCEDWDMWLRLAVAGVNFVSTGNIGAVYRRYPGSMSGNKDRMRDSGLAVLGRYLHVHDGCRRCAESSRQGRRWIRENWYWSTVAPILAREAHHGIVYKMKFLARSMIADPRLLRQVAQHACSSVGRPFW